LRTVALAAAFLAGLTLAVAFAVGRLAERRVGVRFLALLIDVRAFLAFRLAIALSFPNLDSLPISVVRSVAYRNLQKPRGGPAPAKRNSGNRLTRQRQL
jgi:hypothetical protein